MALPRQSNISAQLLQFRRGRWVEETRTMVKDVREKNEGYTDLEKRLRLIALYLGVDVFSSSSVRCEVGILARSPE